MTVTHTHTQTHTHTHTYTHTHTMTTTCNIHMSEELLQYMYIHKKQTFVNKFTNSLHNSFNAGKTGKYTHIAVGKLANREAIGKLAKLERLPLQ